MLCFHSIWRYDEDLIYKFDWLHNLRLWSWKSKILNLCSQIELFIAPWKLMDAPNYKRIMQKLQNHRKLLPRKNNAYKKFSVGILKVISLPSTPFPLLKLNCTLKLKILSHSKTKNWAKLLSVPIPIVRAPQNGIK